MSNISPVGDDSITTSSPLITNPLKSTSATSAFRQIKVDNGSVGTKSTESIVHEPFAKMGSSSSKDCPIGESRASFGFNGDPLNRLDNSRISQQMLGTNSGIRRDNINSFVSDNSDVFLQNSFSNPVKHLDAPKAKPLGLLEKMTPILEEIVTTEITFLGNVAMMKSFAETAIKNESATEDEKQVLEEAKEACDSVLENSFIKMKLAEAKPGAEEISFDDLADYFGSQLEPSNSDSLEGPIFAKFEASMEFLCLNQDSLAQLVEKLNPEANSLDVRASFITSVQRLPRYGLFFQDIAAKAGGEVEINNRKITDAKGELKVEVKEGLEKARIRNSDVRDKSVLTHSRIANSAKSINEKRREGELEKSKNFISSLPDIVQDKNSWIRRLFGFFNKSTRDNRKELEAICKNTLFASENIEDLVKEKCSGLSAKAKKDLARCIEKRIDWKPKIGQPGQFVLSTSDQRLLDISKALRKSS